VSAVDLYVLLAHVDQQSTRQTAEMFDQNMMGSAASMLSYEHREARDHARAALPLERA
jgi:hypothetical protein